MQMILIVEDDPAIVTALEQYLRTEEFDPVSAKGEREAVRLMDSFSPELVLIDISLSEGDGFSVCREAKARGIPSVFLTASGDENSVVEGWIWERTITSQSRTARGNWCRGSGPSSAGTERDRAS